MGFLASTRNFTRTLHPIAWRNCEKAMFSRVFIDSLWDGCERISCEAGKTRFRSVAHSCHFPNDVCFIVFSNCRFQIPEVLECVPTVCEEIGFSPSSLRSAVVSVAPICVCSYLIAGRVFDDDVSGLRSQFIESDRLESGHIFNTYRKEPIFQKNEGRLLVRQNRSAPAN